MNTISSRTPEGAPNHCPVCDSEIRIEPSQPAFDAPCPKCGTLLWFLKTSACTRIYETEAIAPIRDKIVDRISERLGIPKEQVLRSTSFIEDVGADSLDIVELVMELEEEFEISVPDDEAQRIKTVQDALDYIIRNTRR
jgi:acyl carrier protein